MKTVSINFQIPASWSELSDKQLRYVYQLIADNFATDEIKTLCLLRWSGTKVIGRQEFGSYLLRKGRARSEEERGSKPSSLLTRPSPLYFEVTPLTIAELLPHLDWLGSLPTAPVRLSKINRQNALPADFSEVSFADFSEVSFADFIICDNLYQGYLQTQDDNLLDQLGSTLYGKSMTFKPYERINIFYWFAALKDSLANKYSDFFQPTSDAATGGNLLGSPSLSVEDAMNAQLRALTKGDVTKEAEVLALDTHRALTELNAQAKEYKDFNAKYGNK